MDKKMKNPGPLETAARGFIFVSVSAGNYISVVRTFFRRAKRGREFS